MPTYRILLVEEQVESDCAEFKVAASTPRDGAKILAGAHARARDKSSNWVSLPDGQSARIEPNNLVRTRVYCVLLDDEGNEVEEIDLDGPAPSPQLDSRATSGKRKRGPRSSR
ncbi:hypothetical protein [Methylosinus sp. KRF6]|uniref:hypothetical protein n=1 Tax=Methylosinus sp. KRF6 TaxID=2846853 RepID=UPI001C0ADB58|nr:hypothetical protein [Methylosinus sp. KRF6]MBU3887953.1 hypothetical protein [Methylosinus sp. KRF6]